MAKAKVPILVNIPIISDARGDLGVIEASTLAGFDFRRVYYLFGTEGAASRGAHAHKALKQLIVCLHGGVRIKLEYAGGSAEFVLSDPTEGVLVPAGCWRVLDGFSDDAVVAVLASEEFDEQDYIRDYAQFKTWIADESSERSLVPYLPLERVYEFLGLSLERATIDVMRSGPYIGGNAVEKFEHEFAQYCGSAYAIGCANGLDALVLILESLDIGQGDEVIVPTNSFIASALAVTHVGARPILVDCDPSTYSVNIDSIRHAITNRTRAIMPVHLFGTPADMSAIVSIAAEYGLEVVEDAAQAHGAEYKGKRVGSFGRAAAFSFYPTKNLGALGDGGCITTNDMNLAERIRMKANYGSRIKYKHETTGRNSRLDPIQAAVLSVKLPHLDRWNAQRRKLASIYFQSLEDIKLFSLPQVTVGSLPVWHVFPLRVHSGRRDECINYLMAENIGSNVHYPTPIHRQPPYRGDGSSCCPISELIAGEVISLPLMPFHTDEEIHKVAKHLKRFAASSL